MKVGIVDNIKLSLDLVSDSFRHLKEDPDDTKNYKLAILNLHSSLELTFKLMLMNRNEFMLFSLSGGGFDNIMKKYIKAKQEGYIYLLDYYENNPTEEQPHTVTFK